MIYKITAFLFFVIFKLFFKLKIYGIENVPCRGAFIIACNHSSHLDPPIVGGACIFRRDLNFLAKEELFHSRAFAWYLRHLKSIPVKRERADLGAIKESIKRIKKGEPLVVFPEGWRSIDGQIQAGLPGIALIAAKTSVPVVPAFIKGSYEALKPGVKFIKLNRIFLKFGKPQVFKKDATNDYPEITDKIMSSIKALSYTL